MDILFVATELAPVAKVGGLGDVVFALSKATKLLGHNVTLLIPRYRAFEETGVMLARRLTPLDLASDLLPPGAPSQAVLFDGRLGSGVNLIAVDVPTGPSSGSGQGFYDRAGIYGDPGGAEYADNAARFGLLCRAAAALIKQRAHDGQPFDVVHCHDWPAAMVPYLLREARKDALENGRPPVSTKSVLTIHNLGHDGGGADGLRKEDLGHFGLSAAHFGIDGVEFFGRFSPLKGGILAADQVTTVSETYAEEVRQDGHADRFAGVFAARKTKLIGVRNGVDYSVWNPATDSNIVSRYDAEDSTNKQRSKSALLYDHGLELTDGRPLVVSIGRIVPQKGADILAQAMPKLLNFDLTLIVAGTGEKSLETALAKAAHTAPERARYLGHVSEQVSHRLIAAADFVLVPSRYEPCGLVQLYAQRYGALPIATNTGGLADTIVDLDGALETGTGFLFDGPTLSPQQMKENLIGAVGRAVSAAAHPRFPALRKRVMRLDLGWERPARRYAQLYKLAIES